MALFAYPHKDRVEYISCIHILYLGFKMNILSSLLLVLFSLSLFSCTTISKEDCKKDMKSFGLEQGRKGLADLSDDIRKICIRSDSSVDLESYVKGFNMGWSEYCTPLHGFENGQNVELYKSFCPSNKEELYREKFFIGKALVEKRDQLSEFDDKIKKSPNDNELKESISQLKREIQILEQQGTSPVHAN